MVIFKSIILAIILVYFDHLHQSKVSAVEKTNSIFEKIRKRICASKYGLRTRFCQNEVNEETTTAVTQPDHELPVTVATNLEITNSGLPDIDVTLINTTATVKQIDKRKNVIVTKTTRQATMSRGPDGLHVETDVIAKTSQSQLICASECISSTQCLGFAFSLLEKECQLFSDSTLESGEFVNETGWRIYYL